jgi:hypothetical protein
MNGSNDQHRPGTVRYRFIRSDGEFYYWESVLPLYGDSRHEQIKCSITWFWGRERAKRDVHD